MKTTTINLASRSFTIGLDLDYDDSDEGMIGDGYWSFPANVAALFADALLIESNDYREFRTPFRDRTEDGPDGESWGHVDDEDGQANPDTPMLLDLDAGFAALAYLDALDAEAVDGALDADHIKLTTANPFWAHHDAAHATYDCSADPRGYGFGAPYVVIGTVDGEAEIRAHVVGGINALNAGVAGADVVRAIVGSEQVFRDRYGYTSDALAQLLTRCEITTKGGGR